MGGILTAAACRRSIRSTVVTSNIYVKVESKRFQHLDLFSHLLSAVKLAMAAAREEPMAFLPMVAAYPAKYCIPSVPHLKDSKSWVRDSEAEHIEENLCAPSHRRRLPPYGPISRAGKTPTYFIPSVCSPEHSSAHCTGQEKHKRTRRTAAVELSISASSYRDWLETPALRPAVTRYSSRGETRGTLEKHLLAVPDEMKCYCPLRLSPCSASQVQLLLHPQPCFCARFW